MLEVKFKSMVYNALSVGQNQCFFLQKGDYGAAETYCQEAGAAASKAQDPETIDRALECVKRAEDLRRKNKDSNNNS